MVYFYSCSIHCKFIELRFELSLSSVLPLNYSPEGAGVYEKGLSSNCLIASFTIGSSVLVNLGIMGSGSSEGLSPSSELLELLIESPRRGS